jgi:hypothetical protein
MGWSQEQLETALALAQQSALSGSSVDEHNFRRCIVALQPDVKTPRGSRKSFALSACWTLRNTRRRTVFPSPKPARRSKVAAEAPDLWRNPLFHLTRSTDRRGTDKTIPLRRFQLLYKAARQTDQRNWVYDNNKDIHRNISSKGRQTLATLGTDLYANHPVIRGAINEMAYYSLGVWIPEYYGRNPAWGDLAEAWMYEHDKICNVDGGTMLDYLLNLVRGVLVRVTLRRFTPRRINGYPKLQQIPGHRIKSGDGRKDHRQAANSMAQP